MNFWDPAAKLISEFIALLFFLNGGLPALWWFFFIIWGLNVHSYSSFSSLMTPAHYWMSSLFLRYWFPQVRSLSCTVRSYPTLVLFNLSLLFSNDFGRLGSRSPVSINKGLFSFSFWYWHIWYRSIGSLGLGKFSSDYLLVVLLFFL